MWRKQCNPWAFCNGRRKTNVLHSLRIKNRLFFCSKWPIRRICEQLKRTLHVSPISRVIARIAKATLRKRWWGACLTQSVSILNSNHSSQISTPGPTWPRLYKQVKTKTWIRTWGKTEAYGHFLALLKPSCLPMFPSKQFKEGKICFMYFLHLPSNHNTFLGNERLLSVIFQKVGG